MDREILEYALARKAGNSNDDPTWDEVANELYVKFGFQVGSISGLRSRISEYRRKAAMPPRADSLPSPADSSTFDLPPSLNWGQPPQLVEPATHELWETVVFVSDIHVPYHDATLLHAACELIADVQPHRLVINGDTNDFFQLSRFDKTGERAWALQEELDLGIQVRRELRAAAPNARIEETLGNHDERLITYVEINAVALSSLQALQPAKLLGLDDVEITHHPRCGFRLRPEFIVEHGHVARKDSGASAKARLNDTLVSGIMGHVHRLDSYRRSGYRKLSWYEQGCLCLTSPDYIVGDPNWQPGIAIGMFSTRTETFNVELLPAVNRGFVFGGRAFGDITDPILENV